MSIPRQITEFLDSHHVRYRHATHERKLTAQETAQAQHVSGKILAKAVMIMADNRLVMAVLPASHRVDLPALQRLLGAGTTRLAKEEEFVRVFLGCEPGAMPPLGNIYHIDVWLDAALRGHPALVFNAGTHTDTIEMSLADLERLVSPHLGTFASITR